MKNQKNSLAKLLEIAQSFRAIANPNRIAIIDMLAQGLVTRHSNDKNEKE